MKEEKKSIEDAFWFLNHCRASREHPSRPVKRKGVQRKHGPFKCVLCGELEYGRGSPFASTVDFDPLVQHRVCTKCRNVIIEKALKEARTINEAKSLYLLNQFRDRLAECEKAGTCDILAAHHDFLKDDPDRLRTDFLINLVCGSEKAKKYKKPIEVEEG